MHAIYDSLLGNFVILVRTLLCSCADSRALTQIEDLQSTN